MQSKTATTNAPVILILLDACRYEAIEQYSGYLENLVALGTAAKYRVTGELPSISRPMYETVMTGLNSAQHGISANSIVRKSRCENLFKLCCDNGLKTAAAAFHWMSELYNDRSVTLGGGRYQLDSDGWIHHGIYYTADSYPDSHLFADAAYLFDHYQPDFLLLHPMNIDDVGHRFGGESREYAHAVATAADLLAQLVPVWIEAGAQVIITADHGMDGNGIHGGITTMQREVPLYIISPKCQGGEFTQEPISQLEVAPLVCRLLGITPPEQMLSKINIRLNDI